MGCGGSCKITGRNSFHPNGEPMNDGYWRNPTPIININYDAFPMCQPVSGFEIAVVRQNPDECIQLGELPPGCRVVFNWDVDLFTADTPLNLDFFTQQVLIPIGLVADVIPANSTNLWVNDIQYRNSARSILPDTVANTSTTKRVSLQQFEIANVEAGVAPFPREAPPVDPNNGLRVILESGTSRANTRGQMWFEVPEITPDGLYVHPMWGPCCIPVEPRPGMPIKPPSGRPELASPVPAGTLARGVVGARPPNAGGRQLEP